MKIFGIIGQPGQQPASGRTLFPSLAVIMSFKCNFYMVTNCIGGRKRICTILPDFVGLLYIGKELCFFYYLELQDHSLYSVFKVY